MKPKKLFPPIQSPPHFPDCFFLHLPCRRWVQQSDRKKTNQLYKIQLLKKNMWNGTYKSFPKFMNMSCIIFNVLYFTWWMIADVLKDWRRSFSHQIVHHLPKLIKFNHPPSGVSSPRFSCFLFLSFNSRREEKKHKAKNPMFSFLLYQLYNCRKECSFLGPISHWSLIAALSDP